MQLRKGNASVCDGDVGKDAKENGGALSKCMRRGEWGIWGFQALGWGIGDIRPCGGEIRQDTRSDGDVRKDAKEDGGALGHVYQSGGEWGSWGFLTLARDWVYQALWWGRCGC